jgi:uncharacterized membrane protein
MQKPPPRVALYIGVLLVVAGLAAIAVGWWKSSRLDIEAGQIPYVISGGFGGLGLIVLGAGAIVMDVLQRSMWHVRRAVEDLRVTTPEPDEQPEEQTSNGPSRTSRRRRSPAR